MKALSLLTLLIQVEPLAPNCWIHSQRQFWYFIFFTTLLLPNPIKIVHSFRLNPRFHVCSFNFWIRALPPPFPPSSKSFPKSKRLGSWVVSVELNSQVQTSIRLNGFEISYANDCPITPPIPNSSPFCGEWKFNEVLLPPSIAASSKTFPKSKQLGAWKVVVWLNSQVQTSVWLCGLEFSWPASPLLASIPPVWIFKKN